MELISNAGLWHDFSLTVSYSMKFKSQNDPPVEITIASAAVES